MSFSISAQYIAFRFEVSNFMPWCLANYLAAQSCRHFRQCQNLSFHDVFRVTGWQWWHGSWIPMDPYGSLRFGGGCSDWFGIFNGFWRWTSYSSGISSWVAGEKKTTRRTRLRLNTGYTMVCPKIHHLSNHYPPENGHGFGWIWGIQQFWDTQMSHWSHCSASTGESRCIPMKIPWKHHWITIESAVRWSSVIDVLKRGLPRLDSSGLVGCAGCAGCATSLENHLPTLGFALRPWKWSLKVVWIAAPSIPSLWMFMAILGWVNMNQSNLGDAMVY